MKSEWKTCLLNDLVTFTSGGTPSKKQTEYWNGSIPWISAKTMKKERISTSDRMISQEGLKNGSQLAPEGSVLLLVRGSGLFNSIPICLAEKPVAFNQDIRCINTCSEIENKYIFYWLLSQSGILKNLVGVTAVGTGKLDMHSIKHLEITYPDKQKRQKIIKIADAVSDKINLNTEIKQNLEQQAQIIFKRITADIQKHVPFTSVIQVCGGGTPRTDKKEYWNGEIPFFTPKDAEKPYVITTEKYITSSGLNNCSSRLYPVNTVFLTVRGTVGKVSLAGVPMGMNQSCYAFIGKNGLHQLIVYHHVLELLEILKYKANGVIFDAVTARDFNTETVPVLSEKQMTVFLSAAEPFYNEILNRTLENQRLFALREILLPELMTDRIKI